MGLRPRSFFIPGAKKAKRRKRKVTSKKRVLNTRGKKPNKKKKLRYNVVFSRKIFFSPLLEARGVRER